MIYYIRKKLRRKSDERKKYAKQKHWDWKITRKENKSKRNNANCLSSNSSYTTNISRNKHKPGIRWKRNNIKSSRIKAKVRQCNSFRLIKNDDSKILNRRHGRRQNRRTCKTEFWWDNRRKRCNKCTSSSWKKTWNRKW